MAIRLWIEAGFDRIVDKFLDDYYFPFEDSYVRPIEDAIGMELGYSSRAFFPLAVLTQLFLICAHASVGFSTIKYGFRLLVAFGSFLSLLTMFFFSIDSFSAINIQFRLKQMPSARIYSDAQSSVDFMMIFGFLSLISLWFSIGVSGFSGWYLTVNVIVGMITAATTMKHMQACYTLTNENDLPKVIDDEEKMKAQSRKIIKMESIIEGQNYKLLQANEELDDQTSKLTKEKIDVMAQLKTKNKVIEKLRDDNSEYGRIIDWYSEIYGSDQKYIKELQHKNAQLESDKDQLAKRNVELVRLNTGLERCHADGKKAYETLIENFDAAQKQAREKHQACADGLSNDYTRVLNEKKRSEQYWCHILRDFQAKVELLKRDNDRLRGNHGDWVKWYNDVFCKHMALYEQACAKNAEMEQDLNITHITLEACRLTLGKKEEHLQQSLAQLKQFQDMAREVTGKAEEKTKDQSEADQETVADSLSDEELEERYEADDESDVGSYAEVNEVASEVEYNESDVEFVTEGDTDDEMTHWAFVESDNEL